MNSNLTKPLLEDPLLKYYFSPCNIVVVSFLRVSVKTVIRPTKKRKERRKRKERKDGKERDEKSKKVGWKGKDPRVRKRDQILVRTFTTEYFGRPS